MTGLDLLLTQLLPFKCHIHRLANRLFHEDSIAPLSPFIIEVEGIFLHVGKAAQQQTLYY